MKKLIAIIIVIFFTSCSITGTYFTGDGLRYDKLILKNNNKFTYIQFSDVGGGHSINGKWTKNENILTLNSIEQPNYKPNSIFDTLIQWDRNEKLIVFGAIDYVMGFTDKWIISINNGQEIDTLDYCSEIHNIRKEFEFIPFGSAVFTTIDSIGSIKVINTQDRWTDCILRDSTFYISNSKSNIILIYPDPYNLYYGAQYMVNTEWKIKNRKIYIWRKGNGKYSNSYCLKKRLKE
jgi:hypothetical protein